uniref:Uncharacterized protein n=1 Tax=viral metagenome TaxID=1070528 RepID=A0A6C0B9M4_9ZZZZ
MNEICTHIKKFNDMPNKYERFEIQIDPTMYECPPEVNEDMKNLTYGIEYNSELTIPIRLLFFTKTQNDCLDRFHIVMTLLRYMLQFPNTLTSVQIDFAFTSVPKELPKQKNEVIGPSTLNTGYTTGNQIVVYREEEWLKVFIHECMHLFLYDLELRDKPTILYSLFPISKQINVNESYCELWARILNCCVISVMNHISLEQLLEKEKKHSSEQLIKVLRYMKLTYPQLMDKTTDYKEETNAFAYLVVPAILIQDPYQFVVWCKQHNENMLPIQSSPAYVKLIQSKYKSQDFLQSTNSSLSTKMSINNIHL